MSRQSVYKSSLHRSAVYSWMIESVGCGPFDGGCLLFANALKEIHDGEVWVIESSNRWSDKRVAQHAVLKLPNGRFGDADGIRDANSCIQHFMRNEGHFLNKPILREWRVGDLPDAVLSDSFIEDLTSMLNQEVEVSRPNYEACI